MFNIKLSKKIFVVILSGIILLSISFLLPFNLLRAEEINEQNVNYIQISTPEELQEAIDLASMTELTNIEITQDILLNETQIEILGDKKIKIYSLSKITIDCFNSESRAFYIDSENQNYLSQITFENLRFINGIADEDCGGAILANYFDKLNIINCEFSQNCCSIFGGAIAGNFFNEMNILNCEFLYNVSENFGSAIGAENFGEINIKNSVFIGNYAENSEEEIYVDFNDNLFIDDDEETISTETTTTTTETTTELTTTDITQETTETTIETSIEVETTTEIPEETSTETTTNITTESVTSTETSSVTTTTEPVQTTTETSTESTTTTSENITENETESVMNEDSFVYDLNDNNYLSKIQEYVINIIEKTELEGVKNFAGLWVKNGLYDGDWGEEFTRYKENFSTFSLVRFRTISDISERSNTIQLFTRYSYTVTFEVFEINGNENEFYSRMHGEKVFPPDTNDFVGVTWIDNNGKKWDFSKDYVQENVTFKPQRTQQKPQATTKKPDVILPPILTSNEPIETKEIITENIKESETETSTESTNKSTSKNTKITEFKSQNIQENSTESIITPETTTSVSTSSTSNNVTNSEIETTKEEENQTTSTSSGVVNSTKENQKSTSNIQEKFTMSTTETTTNSYKNGVENTINTVKNEAEFKERENEKSAAYRNLNDENLNENYEVETVKTVKKENPQTGDNIAVIVIVAVICAGAAVVFAKSRKN